jgi:hypothetical protein
MQPAEIRDTCSEGYKPSQMAKLIRCLNVLPNTGCCTFIELQFKEKDLFPQNHIVHNYKELI